jgi:Ca-activated chloride channel family protein
MKANRLFSKIFVVLIISLLAGPAWSDGFIIIPPQPIPRPVPIVHIPYQFAPLEVQYHRVTVDIDDQKAVTSIEQAFFNPNNRRLEGTYIFPVPKNSHIDSFSMDVDGKMLEAELLSAEKARKIYEDIVRRAKDPALLEYAGRKAFKVRIYPIEPRSSKKIKISYTQILQADFGMMEYLYPLNTEKFSAAPLQEVSIRVNIRTNGKKALKNIYSPSHQVEVIRHGEQQAVVGFEQKNVRPDQDFKLIFTESSKEMGMDLLTYRPGKDEPGYFMLMISPGDLQTKNSGRILAKDLTLIMDTSGSMAGKKIIQARKALTFCLDNLNEQDRFEIIRFSTEAEPFFQKPVPAAEENLAPARRFVSKLKPIGGTAIYEALEKGLQLQDKTDQRAKMLLFITDGLPTIGETDEEAIVSLPARYNNGSRIFTFGLGHDVNTHLLDRLAEKSRGLSRYVAPDEDLEIKLSNFYKKISDPVMLSPRLEIPDNSIRVSKLQPRQLQDIFNGDQLLIFGRYDGTGKTLISLSGTIAGKQQTIDQSVFFSGQTDDNRFIAEMWATRRVGWLLDQIRYNGESKEVKEEIIALAREFAIVTPYTAYLIMEDEQIRNVPVSRRNYRELEDDVLRFSQTQNSYRSIAGEAGDKTQRSGKVAVHNARSVQKLKEEKSTQYRSSASPSLEKSSSAGNYSQQVRVINGRAFYRNGSVWNDSTAQGKTDLRIVQIAFDSPDYYIFLNSHKQLAPWLSLGTDVDIVLESTLYQIRAR